MNRTRVASVIFALGLVLAGCGRPAAPPQHVPSPTAPVLPAKVSASINTDHGPGDLVVTADAVYVGNHRGGTIQRIDPATNRVTSTVLVGGQLRISAGADPAGRLWACTNVDGAMHQVDMASGKVTATVQVSCDGGWSSVIDGNLWCVSGGDSPTLSVIDSQSAKVTHSYPVAKYSGPIAEANGKVLVGVIGTSSTPSFQHDGTKSAAIAAETPWLWNAGGKLYVMPMDGSLAELDPVTLKAVKTFHVPPHNDGDPSLAADDSGHLYYRPEYSHLYRIDTATGQVDTFMDLPWEETPTGIAWGFGSLWLTNFDSDTVWRINTKA